MGAAYVYRGTNPPETPTRGPGGSSAMSKAAETSLCLAVLAVLAGIQAVQVEAGRRAYEAHARTCCSVCDALYAGATCDLCRARLEAIA